MKKLLAILCVVTVLLGFSACTGGNAAQPTDSVVPAAAEVDMSAFPSEVSEWSGQNFIDYFKAQGLFTDDGNYETWLQNHTEYWPGTPVSECAGWWDVDGTDCCVMILILDPSLADSSQEDYDEWITEIKTNKNLPGEYSALGGVDHLVGNVAFSYSSMTLSDDSLAKIDAAYEQFVSDTGVTPEF